ncbi:hypothetical protein TNCV_1234991 [Trichonephila clavipes]|nr:hypothetical protein TNCV_1234991 [Trichonephila clavipes]
MLLPYTVTNVGKVIEIGRPDWTTSEPAVAYTKERSNRDLTGRLDKVTLFLENSVLGPQHNGCPGLRNSDIGCGTNFQQQLGHHYRREIAVSSELLKWTEM